jgi:hypothetical protein
VGEGLENSWGLKEEEEEEDETVELKMELEEGHEEKGRGNYLPKFCFPWVSETDSPGPRSVCAVFYGHSWQDSTE